MRLSTIAASALFASLSTAPAAAQYSAPQQASPVAQMAVPPQAQAQPAVKVSKQAGKAISELQAAVVANDTATIPAKLAAAQQVAATNEDRYFIAELRLKAALAASDRQAISAAVDAIAASGAAAKPRLLDLYSALGVEFYNAKQYDRAAALFERAAALDPSDVEQLTLLAEAQNSLGQSAKGAATLQKAIQLAAAAGKKPEEKLYKRGVGMAYRANPTAAIELGQQWIAAYPSTESWTNAIAIYRNALHPDLGGTLDLLRVMRAAGALSRPEDFAAYVKSAQDQNNFGEAQAVLDEALAAKQLELSNPLVAEVRSKPKPTLPDLAAAAKTAQSVRALIGIGDRYYGLGEYARAVDVYRQAIAKGGDANLANLHLGMALARAGDEAGATAALNAVGGADAGIAKFWLLFVRQDG